MNRHNKLITEFFLNSDENDKYATEIQHSELEEQTAESGELALGLEEWLLWLEECETIEDDFFMPSSFLDENDIHATEIILGELEEQTAESGELAVLLDDLQNELHCWEEENLMIEYGREAQYYYRYRVFAPTAYELLEEEQLHEIESMSLETIPEEALKNLNLENTNTKK